MLALDWLKEHVDLNAWCDSMEDSLKLRLSGYAQSTAQTDM